MTADLRLAQIAEALDHLERVFADPSSSGDCTIQDAAVSLASEFVGDCRDDEILGRLDRLVAAEQRGCPKQARAHLLAVGHRIRSRWSEDSTEGPRNVAKALVAATPSSPPPAQPGRMADRRRTPALAGAR